MALRREARASRDVPVRKVRIHEPVVAGGRAHVEHVPARGAEPRTHHVWENPGEPCSTREDELLTGDRPAGLHLDLREPTPGLASESCSADDELAARLLERVSHRLGSLPGAEETGVRLEEADADVIGE